MKTALMMEFLATAAALYLAGGHARALAEPSRLPTKCAYARSAASDGCDGSHPRATTIHPDFFTGYAAQSHQNTYRVRPDWNVAGVDYPVGFYTPLERLKDIRHVQPTGCKLSLLAGTQILRCSGSGHLMVSGYRFDKDGGTWLLIDGQHYNSINVDDCYFLNGKAVDRHNGALITVFEGGAPLIITNSTFDGDGRVRTLGMSYLVADSRRGAQDDVFEYNAMFRVPQKGLGTGPCGKTDVRYNYFEELELGASHGEFTIDGTSLCTKTLLDVSYNTGLLPAATVRTAPVGGVTTLLYLSGGNPKRSWKDIVATHNTLVANSLPSGAAITSRMIEQNYGTVTGTMEYSNNFIDPTGSLLCYYVPTSKPAKTIFKGNKNLLDASRADDFSYDACRGRHK